jgi:hypothetical protein
MGKDNTVHYGIDRLRQHCAMLNSYKWVRASGKEYVIAMDENGRHYLDFRSARNA